MTNTHWTLVANGEKLSPKKLRQLTKSRSVIACDGGIQSCLDLGIIPQKLLGDFDSIEPELLKKLNQTACEILPATDQNKTDSEKALINLIDSGCEDIIICQAMGDRTDHSLINLSLLRRYYSKTRRLTLAREKEAVIFARDETITICGEVGSGVAIMGFNQATVTTNGLKYECNNLELNINGASSGCNSLIETEATIRVVGDALITQF